MEDSEWDDIYKEDEPNLRELAMVEKYNQDCKK